MKPLLQTVLISCCLLTLAGCATTHPGNIGESLSPATEARLPLKISARTLGDPYTEVRPASYQLIELTMENTGDRWLKVNESQVLISDNLASQMSVVLGRDLKDWGQAMELQMQKDQYNRQLLQTALVGVGAVAVVAGSHNNSASAVAAGELSMAGGEAWAVADTIHAAHQAAQGMNMIPENHLYQPFSVPGKMFLRRRVLINKPPKAIMDKLVVKLETAEGQEEEYAIPL